MYFETFSKRAKRSVFFAHYYAKRDGSPTIEPEHLVRGLLREDPELFELVSPDDASLVESIQKQFPEGSDTKQAQQKEGFLPLSKAARQVINSANGARSRFKHNSTGTGHLLLAVVSTPSKNRGWFGSLINHSVIQDVLGSHGVTAEALLPLLEKGHPTPQTSVVDDSIALVNAKLSALADVLIRQSVFSREEYAALLDEHEGPITAQAFVIPLLDALVARGKLSEDNRSDILKEGESQ